MKTFLLLSLFFGVTISTINGQHCVWCQPTGDCLSNSMICDGQIDCPDGSDEYGCNRICPYPRYYRCSDTGLCIDSYHVCDGIYDCRNGEDEDPYTCSLFKKK